ncbi:MAG: hypothetical protein JNM34_10170 [Chthonomonadaceae bacterium]|nr:hypothetical protein [Chthonomonadaceae bacterium]
MFIPLLIIISESPSYPGTFMETPFADRKSVSWDTAGNTASGGEILGTLNNFPWDMVVDNQRVGRFDHVANTSYDTVNVLMGYKLNIIDPGVTGATVSGGGGFHVPFLVSHINRIGADFGTIGGGVGNQVLGQESTIGGGSFNSIQSNRFESTIGGGASNQIGGKYATIGGGQRNIAGPLGSLVGVSEGQTVAGGIENEAIDFYTTIGGGFRNRAANFTATVAGGNSNDGYGTSVFIGGGAFNKARSGVAVIGGGQQNLADALGAAITGGQNNVVGVYQHPDPNYARFSSILGGSDNVANSQYSNIGGGSHNRIDEKSDGTVIAGGMNNIVPQNAIGSTIAGGRDNEAAGEYATVVGGTNNKSSGKFSVSAGAQNLASGDFSSVPGGLSNIASGTGSLAAGLKARAAFDGCFVWGDSTNALGFASTGPDQFLIKATGNVGVNLNDPKSTVTLNSNIPGVTPGVPALTIGNLNGDSVINLGSTAASFLDFRWSKTLDSAVLQGSSQKDFMLQPFGGRVAIGTTTPFARVPVVANKIGELGVICVATSTSTTTSIPIGGWTLSPNGIGVLGIESGGLCNNTGYAGWFSGDLLATGCVFGFEKAFIIDHPKDPTGKYLVHSSVESNERTNIYKGHVRTDSTGSAWVILPDYFEEINKDFEYQLTVVDETRFAMARVSARIKNGRFKVATSEPGVEVSWQVFATRNDPASRQRPFSDVRIKPPMEQGMYLHPDAYGRPASEGYIPSKTELMRVNK